MKPNPARPKDTHHPNQRGQVRDQTPLCAHSRNQGRGERPLHIHSWQTFQTASHFSSLQGSENNEAGGETPKMGQALPPVGTEHYVWLGERVVNSLCKIL